MTLGEERFNELLSMKITLISPIGLVTKAKRVDVACGQSRLEQDLAFRVQQESVRSLLSNRVPAPAGTDRIQRWVSTTTTLTHISRAKRVRDEAD